MIASIANLPDFLLFFAISVASDSALSGDLYLRHWRITNSR